jgi:hypothetical protein
MRVKVARDPALMRAARSKRPDRRPVCPSCGRVMPPPDEPREYFLEPFGHRRPSDGEPCPGFKKLPSIAPPPPVHVPALSEALRSQVTPVRVASISARAAVCARVVCNRRKSPSTATSSAMDAQLPALAHPLPISPTSLEASSMPEERSNDPVPALAAATQEERGAPARAPRPDLKRKPQRKGLTRTQLRRKRARFVREYLVDRDAGKAAERAGYYKANALEAAARLLANPAIKAAIEKARQAPKHQESARPTSTERATAAAPSAAIAAAGTMDIISVDRSGRLTVGDLERLPPGMSCSIESGAGESAGVRTRSLSIKITWTTENATV